MVLNKDIYYNQFKLKNSKAGFLAAILGLSSCHLAYANDSLFSNPFDKRNTKNTFSSVATRPSTFLTRVEHHPEKTVETYSDGLIAVISRNGDRVESHNGVEVCRVKMPNSDGKCKERLVDNLISSAIATNISSRTSLSSLQSKLYQYARHYLTMKEPVKASKLASEYLKIQHTIHATGTPFTSAENEYRKNLAKELRGSGTSILPSENSAKFRSGTHWGCTGLVLAAKKLNDTEMCSLVEAEIKSIEKAGKDFASLFSSRFGTYVIYVGTAGRIIDSKIRTSSGSDEIDRHSLSWLSEIGPLNIGNPWSFCEKAFLVQLPQNKVTFLREESL